MLLVDKIFADYAHLFPLIISVSSSSHSFFSAKRGVFMVFVFIQVELVFFLVFSKSLRKNSKKSSMHQALEPSNCTFLRFWKWNCKFWKPPYPFSSFCNTPSPLFAPFSAKSTSHTPFLNPPLPFFPMKWGGKRLPRLFQRSEVFVQIHLSQDLWLIYVPYIM